MITFKEYLEFSELEESLSEGIGSTAAGILDAGVSGAGTFVKQLGRGVGNAGWGGVKAAVSGVGSIFGSKESRRKSRQNLGSNLGQVTRGVTQALTSPASAVWRGVEAGRNPFSAMKSGDKGGWGEMLGVRGKYAPPWQELLSKLNSTKDKNERIEIISQMKKFHLAQYKELERKDREQKTKRANAEPYVMPKVPESEFFNKISISDYIEDIYKAHEQGKRLTVDNEKPEVFIKKLLIAYIGSGEKNQNLDTKLNVILKEYFSQIKVKNLGTPEDLKIDLTKENINKISNYINSVYLSIKKEDEIRLPKDLKSFIKSLKFIRDNILSNDRFNKNLYQKLEQLKNQTDEIINHYSPGSGATATATATTATATSTPPATKPANTQHKAGEEISDSDLVAMHKDAGLHGFFPPSADEIRRDARADGFSDVAEYIKWKKMEEEEKEDLRRGYDEPDVRIQYDDDNDDDDEERWRRRLSDWPESI
jgi:hypothetical protein